MDLSFIMSVLFLVHPFSQFVVLKDHKLKSSIFTWVSPSRLALNSNFCLLRIGRVLVALLSFPTCYYLPPAQPLLLSLLRHCFQALANVLAHSFLCFSFFQDFDLSGPHPLVALNSIFYLISPVRCLKPLFGFSASQQLLSVQLHRLSPHTVYKSSVRLLQKQTMR